MGQKISNKRRSNSTLKKEKKSSIFWILIIFLYYFHLAVMGAEALDDWRWGSEVGIMRLKRGLKDIMDVTLEIFWSLF